MYMEGFVSSAADKGSAMCINLLFKTFTLDSEGKMAAACLGVFMMGIICQLLSKFRTSREDSLLNVLVYGFDVTLRYFLMLISMSFSVELFAMIILGLCTGNLLFQTDLVWKSASMKNAEIKKSLLERCSGGSACKDERKYFIGKLIEVDPCCG